MSPQNLTIYCDFCVHFITIIPMLLDTFNPVLMFSHKLMTSIIALSLTTQRLLHLHTTVKWIVLSLWTLNKCKNIQWKHAQKRTWQHFTLCVMCVIIHGIYSSNMYLSHLTSSYTSINYEKNIFVIYDFIALLKILYDSL